MVIIEDEFQSNFPPIMRSSEVFENIQTSLRTLNELCKCSICLSHFTKPVSLPCRHVFCQTCINTSLRKKQECPLCKLKVTRRDLHPSRDVTDILRILPAFKDSWLSIRSLFYLREEYTNVISLTPVVSVNSPTIHTQFPSPATIPSPASQQIYLPSSQPQISTPQFPTSGPIKLKSTPHPSSQPTFLQEDSFHHSLPELKEEEPIDLGFVQEIFPGNENVSSLSNNSPKHSKIQDRTNFFASTNPKDAQLAPLSSGVKPQAHYPNQVTNALTRLLFENDITPQEAEQKKSQETSISNPDTIGDSPTKNFVLNYVGKDDAPQPEDSEPPLFIAIYSEPLDVVEDTLGCSLDSQVVDTIQKQMSSPPPKQKIFQVSELPSVFPNSSTEHSHFETKTPNRVELKRSYSYLSKKSKSPKSRPTPPISPSSNQDPVLLFTALSSEKKKLASRLVQKYGGKIVTAWCDSVSHVLTSPVKIPSEDLHQMKTSRSYPWKACFLTREKTNQFSSLADCTPTQPDAIDATESASLIQTKPIKSCHSNEFVSVPVSSLLQPWIKSLPLGKISKAPFARRTFKYVCGLASGCYILSDSWLECAENFGKWPNEANHLIYSDIGITKRYSGWKESCNLRETFKVPLFIPIPLPWALSLTDLNFQHQSITDRQQSFDCFTTTFRKSLHNSVKDSINEIFPNLNLKETINQLNQSDNNTQINVTARPMLLETSVKTLMLGMGPNRAILYKSFFKSIGVPPPGLLFSWDIWLFHPSMSDMFTDPRNLGLKSPFLTTGPRGQIDAKTPPPKRVSSIRARNKMLIGSAKNKKSAFRPHFTTNENTNSNSKTPSKTSSHFGRNFSNNPRRTGYQTNPNHKSREKLVHQAPHSHSSEFEMIKTIIRLCQGSLHFSGSPPIISEKGPKIPDFSSIVSSQSFLPPFKKSKGFQSKPSSNTTPSYAKNISIPVIPCPTEDNLINDTFSVTHSPSQSSAGISNMRSKRPRDQILDQNFDHKSTSNSQIEQTNFNPHILASSFMWGKPDSIVLVDQDIISNPNRSNTPLLERLNSIFEKNPLISVLSTHWLLDSISVFTILPYDPYLIDHKDVKKTLRDLPE